MAVVTGMDGNPLSTAEWKRVVALLPPNWRALAAGYGLCPSRRDPVTGAERCKLSDPEVLLRLLLHHIATETPLAQTTAQGHAANLVTVSPVALHKRMRTAAPWLAELAAVLDDTASRFAPERWAGYRVFATDATTVTRPGACGTTARVHYRLDVAAQTPQQVAMTDASGGEMLRRFELAAGDLDLLDRAYCNGHDLDHARDAGSDVIVRFNRGTLPLFEGHGRPLDVVPRVLRLARPGRVKAWAARVDTPSGPLAVRVCAVRLSAAAAARAQAWLRRDADRPVTAADLAWAQYVVVVTTVPAARLSARQVLALFRLRWQVELQIKRDKSLGGLAALPNFRADTIASWICGKLLAQALARRLVASAPVPPCAVAVGARAA